MIMQVIEEAISDLLIYTAIHVAFKDMTTEGIMPLEEDDCILVEENI